MKGHEVEFVFAHLFIVIGLAALIRRVTITSIRRSATVIAIIGFVVASLGYWQELDIEQKPGAMAATQYVYDNQTEDSPIIVSSPFIYFSVLHYAEESYQDNTPKLFAQSGEIGHFSGGPILTKEDIIDPSIFETEARTLWVIDTSGFGESRLEPPAPWQSDETVAFPEVRNYQGEIYVTRFTKSSS